MFSPSVSKVKVPLCAVPNEFQGCDHHSGSYADAALTLRSTLDVYTQAITPAKHAAQAAVLSLMFSCETNGTSQLSGSSDVAAQEQGQIGYSEKGHQKGRENVPFWVLDGFAEISASGLV